VDKLLVTFAVSREGVRLPLLVRSPLRILFVLHDSIIQFAQSNYMNDYRVKFRYKSVCTLPRSILIKMMLAACLLKTFSILFTIFCSSRWYTQNTWVFYFLTICSHSFISSLILQISFFLTVDQSILLFQVVQTTLLKDVSKQTHRWKLARLVQIVVTQHTTACCSIQVVDITLVKYQFTNITSLRVVQQKHSGLYSSTKYYKP
jgi:hypothetical protein